MSLLIKNARVINEGEIFTANILIENEKISRIVRHDRPDHNVSVLKGLVEIDASGKVLIPGVIDDQVHFREPGLTHKGDIYSESKAAVAGGITSFMEMPNTVPNTLTQELLEAKYRIASERSLSNYSFYMGASNDNLEEVLKTDATKVCGIKVFMGSSTGNMLVDKRETLENLFSQCKMLIAAHCEDEETIKRNLEAFRQKYNDDIPVTCHPMIRSEEACYKSSSIAVELATKYGTRFHLLHVSTKKELDLLNNEISLPEKRITAEACVHHMWFSDKDYASKGNFIKWNPAIKTSEDRDAILNAVIENKIDVIATDHAPHTIDEKKNTYLKTPSGGPLVQHSLVAMLELYHNGKITIEKIVEKMCHAPAQLFRIKDRGFIREGYKADIVLVDLNHPWKVEAVNILYKCGWSPFEGQTFKSQVTHTLVNGNLVYKRGIFNETHRGQRLHFSVDARS